MNTEKSDCQKRVYPKGLCQLLSESNPNRQQESLHSSAMNSFTMQGKKWKKNFTQKFEGLEAHIETKINHIHRRRLQNYNPYDYSVQNKLEAGLQKDIFELKRKRGRLLRQIENVQNSKKLSSLCAEKRVIYDRRVDEFMTNAKTDIFARLESK